MSQRVNLDSILNFLRKQQPEVKTVFARGSKITLTIFLAYLLASTLTAVSILFFTGTASERPRAGMGIGVSAKRPKIDSQINYNTLKKVVVDRNIFNSAGEVPDEALEAEGGAGMGLFNENDVCHKTSMPIALVGTIYLGATGDSLATIRESGYNEADIYRKGDKIIGYEQAVVHDILYQKVILNNNGVKECLEVVPLKGVFATVSGGGTSAGSSSGGGSSVFTLENAYVEEALGPGFAKILEAGRLVPDLKDNQQRGFKLVGVKNDSLWRRIGMNSGDVITSVNGISMAQPDQGFAVYNSLQDDREIRIEYLKGGKDPTTITVEIK